MPNTKSNKKQKRGNNRNKKVIAVNTPCWFCENSVTPDYKDVEVIRGFLSPRGKILSRKITGICANHQRTLSRSIKIAREIALIS